MSESVTVVSASGKVLIAGGYLVLDPKYNGLVVSTSSRFYTAIRRASAGGEWQIRVRSPQFKDASWHYSANVDGDRITVSQSERDGSKNKFVFIALQQTLQLILEMKGEEHLLNALEGRIDVTIAGDNDFYSQRAKLEELNAKPLISSLSLIPPFSPTGGTLSEVHKTGLGSSAALISSLVTSLLLYFNAITNSFPQDAQKELVHNASQFIHCLAQGKVGSGFDISSAIFGSHIYRRFEPSVIANLMSSCGSTDRQPLLLSTLSPSNKAWNHVVKPFQLPPLTRLMLADVDAGSDTPSLVGKVLKWREAEGEVAHAFWDQLGASNDALGETLLQLGTLYEEDKSLYSHTVELLSRSPGSTWLLTASGSVPVAAAFQDAYSYSEDIRRRMREMGTRADVPIEPPSQTHLLDVCLEQAGVVGCGVPGAGGFDAIWVLVLDPSTLEEKERPMHRVENVWASWTEGSVTPLVAAESFDKGVRVEDVDRVSGLKDLLRL